ncbi:X-ray repair cross-complementing protein 5-like [Oopsacas minuta]|uniref:X-ray repair cross-complementing protein 5-like n=1 Tax=Oopsacas minuta TaxID=111878 RepID=A0AAV7KJH4_9METZ|nr:X-ray repair cross-complementing protein 5-like [Oopsacas minuta]
MAKDLIVLCIDTGPSMGHITAGQAESPLSLSIKIATTMLQQKIFYPTKDEFALVLFGTRETANDLADDDGNYANISIVQKFSQPDLPLLQYLLEEVKHSDISSDFIDALIVSLDLFQKCSGRINEKKIYMFTDAGCPFDDQDQLDQVLTGLNKHSIDLTIIGPDLSPSHDSAMNGSDYHPGDGDNKPGKMVHKSKAQRAGEEILQRIISQGDFASFSFSEALKALTHIKKTQLRQTTVFRGDIEIGPDYKIPTYGYLRVKENKVSSWKKLSAISQCSTNPGSMEVTLARTHHLGDEEQTEISKDQMVKGFRFGKNLIPFASYDLSSTAEPHLKCLQVIGFSRCEFIKRHHFIGDSIVTFVPPVTEGSQAFSSFAQALYEMNCTAIVRYCFRKNANPKLGCLYPHIRPDYTELLFFQLPYAEDIREFTFASLNESEHSQEEIESMDDFLDSMDLSEAFIDPTGDRCEAFEPKYVPNPHIHRMFQCTSHRALNKDSDLPKLDPLINDYLNPTFPGRTNVKNCLEMIQNLCPLIEIGDKKTKKANIFKKDIETGAAPVSEELIENMDIDEALSSDVSKVGSINPVKDFEELSKKHGMFRLACEQMQECIISLIKESFSDQNYPKAISCIESYREVCVKFKQPAMLNKFLQSFRNKIIGSSDNPRDQRHQAFLTLLVKEDITLISKNECDCDVTLEEARLFLQTLHSISTEVDAKNETQDDEVDDLLENM